MEGGDRDIDFSCDICYQSAGQGPIVTPCGHLCCQSCSCTWLRPVHRCPVCDANLEARAQLLPNRPTGVRVATVSAANFILQSLCQMFIRFGEGVLVGIVNLTANLLIQALDRRFPDLIEVAEEKDNVDGEERENDNGLNEAAQVMDNVNGEGSGNDNGSNQAARVMDNVNGEGSGNDNGSNQAAQVMDNVNGEGSGNDNGSNQAAQVMDNVNGEGSGNDNELNEAAQVMDNVNGEGSRNDNGANDAVEVMDNVNREASITSNELREEGEARDNNGDGSSLTVVHPIGGLLPLM